MHRITYFYMYGLWQCPDNKLTLYSVRHERIMEAIARTDEPILKKRDKYEIRKRNHVDHRIHLSR